MRRRHMAVSLKVPLTIQLHASSHEAPALHVRLAAAGEFLRLDFSLKAMAGLSMASTLDDDVRALKAGIRGAWRRLADPALTSFDRRETRNYMKEAEAALSAGLKRLADREQSRRQVETANTAKRLDFRIIQLDV